MKLFIKAALETFAMILIIWALAVVWMYSSPVENFDFAGLIKWQGIAWGVASVFLWLSHKRDARKYKKIMSSKDVTTEVVS